MTHIVLILAYDGTAYFGWQKTKEGPSIEAEVEQALARIFQEPIELRAASRTDRGVHAEWQVVDFLITNPCPVSDDANTLTHWRHQTPDLHRLVMSLNGLLPPDIRCRQALFAPTERFHPTIDVVEKTYRYSISTGPVQKPHVRFTHWHVHYPLTMPLLYETAQLLTGTHDFRGLCNRRPQLNEEKTVRTVSAITINEEPDLDQITVTLTANHFLYKMARNVVGTMIWVARGKTSLGSVRTALELRKRAYSGVTAPAHGLCLHHIHYPIQL